MHRAASTLPGGLVSNGSQRRDFALLPVTGRLELDLLRASSSQDRLAAEELMLSATLGHLGGNPVTSAQLAQLGPADRHYLLARIVSAVCGSLHWISSRCDECNEVLDIAVDLNLLPAVDADEGYPWGTLEDDGHLLGLRAPIATDVEAVRYLDESAAALALLKRCIRTIDGGPPTEGDLDALSTETLCGVDAALERLCPAVAERMETTCPSCGAPQQLDLDPLALLAKGNGEDLLEEIHTLASSYHWSEDQILDLPRERRRRYLHMVDRDRGMLGELEP